MNVQSYKELHEEENLCKFYQKNNTCRSRRLCMAFQRLFNSLTPNALRSKGLMLWLSTKRSNCRFNCATFRLPCFLSLHCPSTNFFHVFDANYRFNQNKPSGAQHTYVLNEFLTADCSCITKYFWKNSNKSLQFTSLRFFWHLLRSNW